MLLYCSPRVSGVVTNNMHVSLVNSITTRSPSHPGWATATQFETISRADSRRK